MTSPAPLPRIPMQAGDVATDGTLHMAVQAATSG